MLLSTFGYKKTVVSEMTQPFFLGFLINDLLINFVQYFQATVCKRRQRQVYVDEPQTVSQFFCPQRSYASCIASQLSGDLPRTFARRSAISGLYSLGFPEAKNSCSRLCLKGLIMLISVARCATRAKQFNDFVKT